jgi:hypothetical protein
MFLHGQTSGDYWRFSDIPSRLDVLLAYPSYDLTWAGMALAGAGLVVCAQRHRALAAFCVMLLALNALIVVTYSIHNIYNYLTPGYAIACVLIGVGCARVSEFARGSSRAIALLLPASLLLLPAALLARNYESLDRSGDYMAYDFARTTLDRLPPRAVVLTDSWTAPPLWYVQLVEGDRRDVFVTPIFSSPGEDPVSFARAQLASGRPVYVAEGLRTRVAVLAESFVLQPVLPNGIETMRTDVLPKPEYRDALVPKASLYRLLNEPPPVVVHAVPSGVARDVPFDAGVTLVGFERHGDVVDGGSVIELTYYWRADRRLDVMPLAVTVFEGQSGGVATVDGWPTWLQSRRIAEGVLDAGMWPVGQIVRESYYVLVPRGLAPGRYQVHVSASSEERPSGGAPSGTTAVGEILVR